MYVVWQDNRNGNWDIYASICSDGGNFSKEVRVTNSNHNEINPALAVDHQSPSRVYVAWQDDRNGNQDIYVASSTNAFATSTVSRVTNNTADQTEPDVAVDAGNVAYVFWTDMRNGQADIYAAASNGSAGLGQCAGRRRARRADPAGRGGRSGNRPAPAVGGQQQRQQGRLLCRAERSAGQSCGRRQH